MLKAVAALPVAAVGLIGPTASVLAAEKAGMPQLDPANFAPQIVWLAIVFVILYLVMSKVALPKVADVLEQRQSRIADDLDEAERLKRQTEKAISDYEQALAKARANAQAIGQKSRDEVNARLGGERGQADQALAGKLKAAEADIATARQAALANVESVAADAARDIVRRIASIDVGEAAAAAAVGAVRKEVG